MKKFDIPLLTFSAETLAAVEGKFTASEFVKKTVGVDNVCERAVCAVGAKITEKKDGFKRYGFGTRKNKYGN